MANNYLQFSEVIGHLTVAEEQWLREQLQSIQVVDGNEYPEDEIPVDLQDAEIEWEGPRVMRDNPDYDADFNSLEFEYAFHDDHDTPDGWGRHLWLYAEESGNPDHVAWLVQKFLQKFRPDQYWSLTWAATCSKPRVGEFSGGAVFVMRCMRWMSRITRDSCITTTQRMQE